jgi:hypothetical protein
MRAITHQPTPQENTQGRHYTPKLPEPGRQTVDPTHPASPKNLKSASNCASWANNHAAAVADLHRLGLVSAYHVARGVAQGAEPEPTLYWRDRRRDGPVYHIDYCFVPRRWTARLAQVVVGGFDAWVGSGLSDHVPLIVEVAL